MTIDLIDRQLQALHAHEERMNAEIETAQAELVLIQKTADARMERINHARKQIWGVAAAREHLQIVRRGAVEERDGVVPPTPEEVDEASPLRQRIQEASAQQQSAVDSETSAGIRRIGPAGP